MNGMECIHIFIESITTANHNFMNSEHPY